MVGNFPQAFSHIALVNAAFDLADEPHTRHPRSSQSASQAGEIKKAAAA
jgi:hypothetical protein